MWGDHYFVEALDIASAPEASAAVVYAPSTLTTRVAGKRIELVTDKAYPFDETIRITVSLDAPLAFPLLLRIPDWCEDATLRVGGEPLHASHYERGFVRVDRRWQTGDVVELHLPMGRACCTARPERSAWRLDRS